jgi:hypothetical protein
LEIFAMNLEPHQLPMQKLKQSICSAVAIAGRAPGPAVGELRRVLDVLIRDLYARKIRDPRTEPLQNLIGPLAKAGHLPPAITDSANLVKDLGNVGVHSAQKTISEADFVSALQNLLQVLRWYEGVGSTTAKDETASDPDGIEDASDHEGPYKGVTVVLPRKGSGSDVAEEWQKIRKYLVNYGVTVVSDEISVKDNSKYQNAFFIQLISTLDPLARDRQKFGRCGLDEGSNRVLRWRKILPKSIADAGFNIDSAVIDGLEPADKAFCEGARTGSFEEFKLEVRSRLEKLSAKWERPYLYLTFDRSNKKDSAYATKLVEVARETADVKVVPSKNQKKDFISAFKLASGFVFLYGDTEPSFIDEWIGNYIEAKRAMKSNLKLAAVYQAPPEKEEMKRVEPMVGLRKEEWRRYGSRDDFIPHDIERYCSELTRDGD